MEILMHGRPPLDYSEESAHTIEVTREEDERGELGSFGFTLLYEKPPIVGTIVPGGPAEKAGLKKNDVVISVNGQSVLHYSHRDVVSLIYHTETPGVWLSVCEPTQRSSNGGNFGRSLGSFSMSQSTPILQRNMMEPRRTAYRDGPPPRYSEVDRYRRNGSGDLLGQRAMVSSVASISGNTRMSPLKRQLLTQSVQNGQGLQNGHGGSGHNLYSSARHLQGLPSSSSSFSIPDGVYTSASVLVLYIGPVELPESWGNRGPSSKCIQECTRRLLSQRQDFFEVFLDVNISGMKVMNVGRKLLFEYERDKLYYSGVCTDDEQYFAFVTRKSDQKGHKKAAIQSDTKAQRADMCHVFKVVQGKSVLALHSTKSKSKQAEVKPKTIPITSCVTIINAVKGLFASEMGGKQLEDSPASLNYSLGVGPTNSSFHSVGSSGSNGSSENIFGSSPEKSSQYPKKKNEVVDLRPEAFSPSSSVSLRSRSSGYSGPPSVNLYHIDSTHVRSHQNHQNQLISTPAYNNSVSGGTSWYSVDSPKEANHRRSGSWDYKSRPHGGGNFVERPDGYGVVGGGHTKARKTGFQHDKARKISDDDSPSTLSSSRTPSPTKSLSFHSRSSFASRSPSPVSYSSGSRSRSASPMKQRSPSPAPFSGRPSRFDTPSVSKLSAGLALESQMWRGGAMSPCPSSIISSVRGSRMNLRRQGSENSVVELQEHFYNQQTPYRGLPLKHTPLTSSIGSLITVADEDGAEEEVEDLGRVAGWVASFDRLLADPLGVQCLLKLLEKEHCEENILFWRDAEEFKQNAPQMKNLQAAVKKIYDEYISPTSPRCINVDDKVQKAVESKLNNPPLNIFSEAQEQIYQLMKMDCYPRFKRSELAKECLLAEVEGRSLPFEMPAEHKPKQHDWKKQKDAGFGRSLFGRWSRARLKDVQQPQPMGASWGISPESKKGKRDSKAAIRKEDSHHSRKSTGAKETRGKISDSRDELTPEDFLPEDHLNVLKEHKNNIYEINLPNKVTKIMATPAKGTVRRAIEPTLKKHGFSLDIMELRFANTFKLVDLESPASILIGQHVIVTKSKNTFIAVFPDVPEKILPADGTKSVGMLFSNVLREDGKSQNFAVYMEGSRVPLELDVDTSVLVGQRVVVKYLPGSTKPSGSAGSSPSMSSKNSKSSLGGSSKNSDKGDMDDLIFMIERLATDKLDDQRTSPTPNTTPEPGLHKSQSSSDGDVCKPHLHRKHKTSSPSSGEFEQKSGHHSKRRSGSHSKKRMPASRSSDQLEMEVKSYKEKENERERGGERVPPTHPGIARSKFSRTQSGGVISSATKYTAPQQRSFSPPAKISTSGAGNFDALQQRGRSLTSPPPPVSKPPPLPGNIGHQRKMSNPTGMFPHHHSSAGSTESDGSLTTEYSSRNFEPPNTRGQQPQEHLYVNRSTRSISAGSIDVPPRYFPGAYPTAESRHHPQLGYSTSTPGPVYMNSTVPTQKARSASMPRQSVRREPGSREEYHQHPLDNFVSQAYSNAPSTGNGHVRQVSLPSRQLEQGTAPHPLHNTVRGPGASYSNYPWHNARRKPSQPSHSTAAARKVLTENQELMQAGERLMQKEIDEYHRQGLEGRDASEEHKTPLSPTTHTVLPEESPYHQRETFV